MYNLVIIIYKLLEQTDASEALDPNSSKEGNTYNDVFAGQVKKRHGRVRMYGLYLHLIYGGIYQVALYPKTKP